MCVVNWCPRSDFESFLARVKHHRIFSVLVARLAESSRSEFVLRTANVATRPWNIELVTLTVENLVVRKARRGCVESNFSSRGDFEITGSCLFGHPAIGVRKAGHLIFNSKNGIPIVHMLSGFVLRHNLVSLSLGRQHANVRVLCAEGCIKAVSCRTENTMRLLPLKSERRFKSIRLGFSFWIQTRGNRVIHCCFCH